MRRGDSVNRPILDPRQRRVRTPATAADLPKSMNHEGHEAHEDSADLAAACGGEAMCERQRPDKT